MFSFLSTERLARVSARRPWLTVGAWIVLLVAGGFLAMGVGDVLTTDQSTAVEFESDKADRLIEERLREPQLPTEQVIVQSDTLTADDAAYRAFVDALVGDIRSLDASAIGDVISFYETDEASLVSDDRTTMLIPVGVLGDEEESAEVLRDRLNERDNVGFTVVAVGEGSIGLTFTEISEADLQTAEIFGLPVALIILAVVFGALVAAGIPIIMALLSIVIGVGVTAVVGMQFELSIFVVNMITMMGLAVGIDYTLFIVERVREERRLGASTADAIAIAGGTANRAVLFSGVTVIVALAGLLIVPDSIFRSLAAGAIIVVVVAILAALTLLPAVLQLLGDRVNWLTLPLVGRKKNASEDGGFWSAIAHIVMRHPAISVMAAVALLVGASLPYFTIELGFAGVSTLPSDTEAFQAFAILEDKFSGGVIEPAEIVVAADDVAVPAVQAGIDELRSALAGDARFGDVTTETSEGNDLALLSVTVQGDPESDAAHDAIAQLRDDYIPAAFAGVDAEVLVTGDTAGTEDYFALINQYTPIVFAFVLGMSFLVLLVVFRSIVVPVKAMIMNLLSVGAAYGLLVLVFQHGVGNELLGFRAVDRIEAWVPLFLFAVLFGLSMDYHVFLLSRIRERFDETGDNRDAIAFGVRSTASIITGAALIMVAVFAGFAMGEMSAFQQMGFGLGAAVVIDATIVRSVLVPASMVLLGDRNWYLPSWLRWLPEIQVESKAKREAAAARREAPGALPEGSRS